MAAGRAGSVGTANLRLSGGHGNAVAHGNGYADLLRQGYHAAGPVRLRHTGDAGLPLTGYRCRANGGRGRQSQGRGHVDALGADLVAVAVAPRGCVFRRLIWQNRFVLVGFIDTQNESLVSC